MVKPQAVGTVQYIEWLILNDRVQPSLFAGVMNPVPYHTPSFTVYTTTAVL